MNRRFKFTYQRSAPDGAIDRHLYVSVDDTDLEAMLRINDEDAVSLDVAAAIYAMDLYPDLLLHYEGDAAPACKLIRMEQMPGIEMDGSEYEHDVVKKIIDGYDNDDNSMLDHIRWHLANVGNLTDAEIQYLLIRGGDEDDHSPEDVRQDLDEMRDPPAPMGTSIADVVRDAIHTDWSAKDNAEIYDWLVHLGNNYGTMVLECDELNHPDALPFESKDMVDVLRGVDREDLERAVERFAAMDRVVEVLLTGLRADPFAEISRDALGRMSDALLYLQHRHRMLKCLWDLAEEVYFWDCPEMHMTDDQIYDRYAAGTKRILANMSETSGTGSKEDETDGKEG